MNQNKTNSDCTYVLNCYSKAVYSVGLRIMLAPLTRNLLFNNTICNISPSP